MKEKEREKIIKCVEQETEGFEIDDIQLKETKHSYFDTIKIYEVITKSKVNLWVLTGDHTPMNLYPKKEYDTVESIYYTHIGLIANLCSQTVHDYFILKFIKDKSIFPIVDMKLKEIEKDVKIGVSSLKLLSLANMIRETLLSLSNYLCTNELRNDNNIKEGDFKNSMDLFIGNLFPGKTNKSRRSFFKNICNEVWTFNSVLVHKKDLTIYDIFNSINSVKLLTSISNNYLTSLEMPFNKGKCPICESEDYIMLKPSNSNYNYKCKNCGEKYSIKI